MLKVIVRVVTALLFVLVTPLAMPSMAQDITPFVIVPDGPGGGGGQIPINGCYRANRDLFGQQFSFCLHRPGTYQVRGGGVRCDGRLTWWGNGRDIQADIHRVSCGNGIAWERAEMTCRPIGSMFGPIGALFLRDLRCTYYPSVRGQRRQTFTAIRQ